MKSSKSNWMRRHWYFGALAIMLLAGWVQVMRAAPKSKAPTAQATKVTHKQEVATFAAGCFWSLEAMFKQLKGVDEVFPGYSGGKTKNPTYNQVLTGKTGHAETINIKFNPKAISYAELLEVLFTVHNPTTLNQQGADVGTQYRSAIFYHNATQKKLAEQAIARVNAAKVWDKPVVTAVEPFKNFTRAEDYHLDYYNQNLYQPYCAGVIGPKMTQFREKFKDKLKP